MYLHPILLFLVLAFIPPLFADNTVQKKLNQGFAFLIPKHQAMLSSEFTGKIKKITVKDAENFKKNQILIQFNCEIRESGLAQSTAQLRSKEAHFDSAKKLEALQSNSLIEAADAKANYEMAVADQKEKQALVDQCNIIAPFDGRVEEIFVHEAEVLAPGTPMIKIIDHEHLYLKLFVPSEWLSWLRIGLPFEIQFHELPGRYKAHLTELGSSVDAASQTIKIYGELDYLSSELLSGMSGEAYFNKKDEP